MLGMNRSTGAATDGYDHLKQSIVDILTTPIGSRVMRRKYGSRLPKLLDRPMNAATIMEVYVATAEALDLWEPRFELSSISAASATAGKLALTLTGVYLVDGNEVTMDGIIL